MDKDNTSILQAVGGEEEEEDFELVMIKEVENKSIGAQPDLRRGGQQEAKLTSSAGSSRQFPSSGSGHAIRSSSSSEASVGSSGRGRGSSSSSTGTASSASSGGKYSRGGAEEGGKAAAGKGDRGVAPGQTGGKRARPYLLPALQVSSWADLKKYQDAVHGAVWVGWERLEELGDKRGAYERELYKSLQELNAEYMLRDALGSALRFAKPVEGFAKPVEGAERKERPDRDAVAVGRVEGVKMMGMVEDLLRSKDKLAEKLEQKDAEIRRLEERCHTLELEKVGLENDRSKREAERKKKKEKNAQKAKRKKERQEERMVTATVGPEASEKRRRVDTGPAVSSERSQGRELIGSKVTVGSNRVVGRSMDGWS